METITSAIVAFFVAQPSMLDQIPNLGHIPKVFNAMTSRNDAIPKAALLVAHELAANDVSCFKFKKIQVANSLGHEFLLFITGTIGYFHLLCTIWHESGYIL